MCGIVGVIDRTGTLAYLLADDARAVADAICYRGRDDEGVSREHGVAPSLRRLAIVELSVESTQPMLSAGRPGRRARVWKDLQSTTLIEVA